jgi:ubiquinone/menaquinone biosynthesis C-methylase UbiE
MLDKSRARVGEMQVGGDRIELVQGDAAALPFESDAFDTVVVTYALCVIPNAKSSLEEIARVLKPEGRAYLVEHVSSDLKPLAQYQKFLSPFIVEFGKGCDWSKDIPGLVQASGLQLVTIDRRVGGTVAFMEVKRKSA